MVAVASGGERYGISILNYSVTSNHIHLIVRDHKGQGAIARSVQLIAGRTGQGILDWSDPNKPADRDRQWEEVSKMRAKNTRVAR
mgnify:CR=1 FL=1